MLLDPALHQAAGLRGYAPERSLRLLAVLSQPGASIALEALWQVCSSLQRLGYPVLVLDGTAAESAHAPGLAQLLAGTPWPQEWADADNTADNGTGYPAASASLAVVPAARGLQRLAALAQHTPASALQPLQPLEALFRTYALVVLYAPPEPLAPLLRASACLPLVLTGPGAQGIVHSYAQIKYMALHAGVRCTVASIAPPGTPANAPQTAQALQALQRSARTHLGLHIHTTTVAAARPQDIQRLALQLLENACTIDAPMPMQPPHHRFSAAAHLDRSH